MNLQARINSWLFPAVSWFTGLLAVLMLTSAPVRWLGLLESQFGLGWLVPVAWLGTFAVVAIVISWALVRQSLVLEQVIRSPLSWLLLAGVCWALATVVWSVDQSSTIRLWVVLAGTVLIGLGLAKASPVQRSLFLLLVAMTLVFVGSVLLYVWIPGLAIHTGGMHDGRWMGLLTHKNHLGNLAALGLVLSAIYIFWVIPQAVDWLVSVFVASLAAVMLVFAESATAVLVAAAGLSVVVLCKVREQLAFAPFWYLALIAGALVGLLAFQEDIFELLGRSSTLTGRTEIWEGLVAEIKNRPFLGFGYEAYWANRDAHSVSMPAGLSGSHNGFIKVWLDQGIVGFALILVCYLWAIGIFVKRFWLRQIGLSTVVAGSLLAMVFVNNLGENTLTQAGSIFHALWVYAVLLLAAPFDRVASSRSGEPSLADTGASS